MTLLETYLTSCRCVDTEETNLALPLTIGRIPDELQGTFFGNGPGRFRHQGVDYQHLFDGDGMITKVRFENGQAYYTNRYVRTREFVEEEQVGEMLYRSFGTNLPGGVTRNLFKMRFKNAANTSVIHHGGKLLALWEGGLPHELDPETLATRGRYDYDGVLQNHVSWLDRQITPELNFSAHPKLHPDTGVLHNFGTIAGTEQRLLSYEVDPQGSARITGSYPLKEMTFVHDFVLTQSHHQIYFLTPVSFDLARAFSGLTTPADSIHSRPGQLTQIMVIHNGQVRYYPTDPCFIFHFANGYEDADGTLVVDGLRMDTFPEGLSTNEMTHEVPEEPSAGLPTRYRITPELGRVECETLSEYFLELPTIHPAYQGKPYRYVWGIGGDPQRKSLLLQGVAKVDTEAKETKFLDVYPHLPGEPLFVPRPGGQAEDDGWLLTMLFDTDLKTNKLLIIDAAAMEIIGELTLPHAQPIGFHGTWHSA